MTVPTTLRTAFEGPDGFAGANAEATAELAAIDRYDKAVGARVVTPDLLQAMGLWATSPDADLARARTLFASGDLTGSAAAAGAAASAWSTAEDVGRGRLVSIGLLVLAAIFALILLASWTRARRVRRMELAADGPRGAAVVSGADPGEDFGRPGATGPSAPDPYATLAASPDPPDRGEVGSEGARGAEPD